MRAPGFLPGCEIESHRRSRSDGYKTHYYVPSPPCTHTIIMRPFLKSKECTVTTCVTGVVVTVGAVALTMMCFYICLHHVSLAR